MKVLLIYPNISKFERYSSRLGSAGGRQLPLGILSVAAFVRERGHEVRFIDAEAGDLTPAEIITAIRDFDARIIGMGSTTVAFHRALAFAGAVKKSLPNIPIVLGGAHVSSNPQSVFAHTEFDYGVMGEGEETFSELLVAVEQGLCLDEIRGLVFRKNGNIRINPARPYFKNLNQLPVPAYDLVTNLKAYTPPPSNYKKLPVMNVITSRGCPNQCTFCDKAVFGHRYRARSAKSIADEIVYLHKVFGAREIAFVDDTFTIGRKRLFELFNILGSIGIQFPWTCMTHINSVDYDLIRYMKKTGCWHVSLGIESGDEEILKLIRKRVSLVKVRRVVGWFHDVGIKTKGFFMLGHPGETEKTMDQTINFALELPLDDVVVTINTPIPGSQQYNEVDDYGTLEKDDWSQFNYWRPVFVPHGLSKQLILNKHREFYRRFYLRPRVMARYAASFLSVAGFRRAGSVLGALPFLFQKQRT